MTANKGFKRLRAGELAQLCGVSTDTLRHYERVGVLAPPGRSPAGYRQYPAESEKRVLLVRRALGLGFTLAELSRLLRTRDQGGAPCREVRALAEQKLAQLERQLADMSALREHLRQLLADWDLRLNGMQEGGRALLLETLVNGPCGKRRSR